MSTKKLRGRCAMIQWALEVGTTDKSGRSVCPQCRQPAMIIPGYGDQPCYTHAPTPPAPGHAVRSRTKATAP